MSFKTLLFPKHQRLRSERLIQVLFEEGNSFFEKPFRAVWKLENNKQASLQTLIIVPKKRIDLAVKRNIIKRRIKEGYRIQKNKLELLLKQKNQQLNLAIIYQNEEILPYKYLEAKINLVLNRILKEL